LPKELIIALTSNFQNAHLKSNHHCASLSHSELLKPESDKLLEQTTALLTPKIADFGELLFGERQDWLIKEIWVNVMATGGAQRLHNHANCFVSGVIYLTECHSSTCTVFQKIRGDRDFVFTNAHQETRQGPFNAEKWIAPPPEPGDVIFFPSYLFHEVPVNQGGLRISMAFNAIPERLNSWGYSIGLTV
jgi:uncharacterized protein (TIGR02466 family)